MVRAQARAPRTRSPLSSRKKGRRWLRFPPRLPVMDGSVEPAKEQFEWSERTRNTALLRAKRVVPRGDATAGLVPLAELTVTLEDLMERKPGGSMPALPAQADLPAIEH